MIDHQRKLLFVHIARTGGTSVESALVGNDWWRIDPKTKHLSARQMRAFYGEDIWNKYKKFSIVRNPWDRVISMWATGWWSPELNMAGIENHSGLKQFIERLSPHEHEEYGSLLFVDIINEELDYILRYETLNSDLNQMLDELGLGQVVLPRLESRKREPYTFYYNDDTKALVQKIFSQDILKYGYSF